LVSVKYFLDGAYQYAGIIYYWRDRQEKIPFRQSMAKWKKETKGGIEQRGWILGVFCIC
jgi:hypothetical protein